MTTPPIFMSFGMLILNLILKIWSYKKLLYGPLKFSKLQWGTKKSEFENYNKKGHIGCKWWEDFKSGPKIQIEQHLTPYLAKNGQKLAKSCFWLFVPKRGSKISWFKLWCQIWNPFVICHPHDPILLKFSNFDFWLPHYNFKNFKWPMQSFFLLQNFQCQIQNKDPKRHKNGWWNHHIAKRMVITTWPSVRPTGINQ